MTEHQHEEELLAELLDVPEAASPADVVPAQGPLTRHDERALLDAAKQAGTATLAPQEFDAARQSEGETFASEAVAFIRRYPIPTLLAGAGIAYLLARSRR